MTETNTVDKLYNNFKDVEKDSPVSDLILSLLYTRIAGALENKEPGSDMTGFPGCDPAWDRANTYLSSLAEKDTEKAFLAGVAMILLPKSPDEKQEKVNRWMRTSGLTVLGLKKEYGKRLADYLEHGASKNELREALIENMKYDLSSFTTEDSFFNPIGFTALQSIYIGLGLKKMKGTAAQNIFEIADSRRTEPTVLRAAGILKTIPGCGYIGDRIK